VDLERDKDSVVEKFLKELESVPWFKNIGKPLPEVATARQFCRWEDWPGPEEPAIFELSKRLQSLYDEILARSAERREELTRLWDRVHKIVFTCASPAVPYDPDKDSWHGPTAAVWQAAWTAGLIAWCVLLGCQIPVELQEQWEWFVRGHWPSGYAEVWADDRLGPLLVL
jgi:hypothetical protein